MWVGGVRRRWRACVAYGLIGALLASSLSVGVGCGGTSPVGDVPDDGVTAAVGDGGEACAVATCDGSGPAWTRTATLTVPAGAQQMLIGSEPGTTNPDLTGAQVRLTSPDGLQTITLAGGAVTHTGLSEESLAAPDTDAAIGSHLEALVGELPADPTDSDWASLAARIASEDATLPQLPSSVLASVESYGEQWRGVENSVAGGGTRKPSDGLLVLGPQPGQWQVEVTCQAGAGAFTAMAMVVPTQISEASLTNMAAALAGVDASTVHGEACTGCDPGCDEDFAKWKNPQFGTAHWFYIKALKTVWSAIVWYLLRGSFTKVIDVMLALFVVEMGAWIAKDEYKAVVIYLVSRLYALILKGYGLAENAVFRFFYCVFNSTRWDQVCYLGVGLGQAVLWPDQIESLERSPGETTDVSLVGANAMMWVLMPDIWGKANPWDTAKSAKWECTPADLLTLTPRATGNSWCAVGAPDPPKSTAGQLTVTVDTQPAKFTCAVKVTMKYVLSGSSEGTASFGVDDDLDVYVNGTQVYTDGNELSGDRGPITIQTKKGDTLRLVVRDTYGHCSGLRPVWLVKGSESTQLTTGFDEGCGHPGGNQGVKFDQTFTVPF